MDYKNDNRTPRDRVTGEFLSELLFTDLGGNGFGDSANYDYNGPTSKKSSKMNSAYPALHSHKNSAPASRKNDCRANGTVIKNCSRLQKNDTGASEKYSLVMAYVRMQEFGDLFDIDKGFGEGTIFRDICFPFYPTPCKKEAE